MQMKLNINKNYYSINIVCIRYVLFWLSEKIKELEKNLWELK